MSLRWLFVYLLAGSGNVFAQTFDEFMAQGDVFYNAQNYKEAIRLFTLAIERDPQNMKGYWYRADAFRQQKEFQKAIIDYTVVLGQENRNPKFYTRRGDCFYSLSQYDLALKDYTEAIALDPENGTLWLYVGDCHSKQNNPENACFAYQKAFFMGDKSGKTQAIQLNCSWAAQQNKPCLSEINATPKIAIENLTGAVLISKGMDYTSFEVIHEPTRQRALQAEFPLNVYYDFLLNAPKGLCQDDEGKVFFGAGFSLSDESGKQLGAIENMFDGAHGVPLEFFKNIKATLDFRKPLDTGNRYVLKLRYFDTRGTGETLVTLPLLLTDSLSAAKEIFETSSTLGKMVTTSSTFPIANLICRPKGKNYFMRDFLFYPYSAYTFSISAQNITKHFKLIAQQMVSQDGTLLPITPSKHWVTGSTLHYELNTWKFKPGHYFIWSKFTNELTGETMGITVPFTIR